eukprot:scaffold44546_cov46-Cyclotella_meneghiniana.AAC.1
MHWNPDFSPTSCDARTRDQTHNNRTTQPHIQTIQTTSQTQRNKEQEQKTQQHRKLTNSTKPNNNVTAGNVSHLSPRRAHHFH